MRGSGPLLSTTSTTAGCFRGFLHTHPPAHMGMPGFSTQDSDTVGGHRHLERSQPLVYPLAGGCAMSMWEAARGLAGRRGVAARVARAVAVEATSARR